MKSNQELVAFGEVTVLMSKLTTTRRLVSSPSFGTVDRQKTMSPCFMCGGRDNPLNWGFIIKADEKIETSVNVCMLCQAMLK